MQTGKPSFTVKVLPPFLQRTREASAAPSMGHSVSKRRRVPSSFSTVAELMKAIPSTSMAAVISDAAKAFD
jgi:hypothetical protein